MTEFGSTEAVLEHLRALGDRAAANARAAAQRRLSEAEDLYEFHRTALAHPGAFARGTTRSETRDLVERSIRAELAVAEGLSEQVIARRLENAQLLMEHLPLTRVLLAQARLHWEEGEAICATAGSLPESSRASLDERVAEAAPSMTLTQLRRALRRWREELHQESLAQRHARARADRAVWVTPDVDGMATLCVYGPAPAVMGAYERADRMARSLRDAGDVRTLAQLRADVAVDLLCDGDVFGTTPDAEDRPDPSYVPGVRGEVRLTLAASTAVDLDDEHAELDGYGPVPADVARELIRTAASFTRVLTERETGAVVSVGRTQRLPPSRMRLHLQLRDQTCRFAGCLRTAARSEADHTIEWSNGGETSLENLVSLCTSHHHLRHGDRWTYTKGAGGAIVWTTPTGRRVSNRPPPLPGRPPDPPRRPCFVDEPPPF
ncbi:HNH endonuclease [Rathayibacter festucae]|uniref:HNH endonuclease n=1 Tax=Rathayibacter festucae TaxID=110937 RepID=UPI002A6A942B|nr:DUF222 domain-containing protein [Rathayibacter festucae]MDY0913489.1 DUF222 domain-containing protein [Rathayibacter festucae]